MVEDDDFTWLNRYRWCYKPEYGPRNDGYAIRRNGKTMVLMHRIITGATEGVQVDHKNGDKLDNRRLNLRLCSAAGNARNVGRRRTNKSGFTGISWNKSVQKWSAYIYIDNKQKYLGYFHDKRVAVFVREQMARIWHGDFAKLNIN